MSLLLQVRTNEKVATSFGVAITTDFGYRLIRVVF